MLSAFENKQPEQERTINGTVTDAQDGQPLPGVAVKLKGKARGAVTNAKGEYSIQVPEGKEVLVFSFIGYVTQEVKIGRKVVINVKLLTDARALEEVVVTGYGNVHLRGLSGRVAGVTTAKQSSGKYTQAIVQPGVQTRYYSSNGQVPYHTEEYDAIHDHEFLEAIKNPLSTFSIDVDRASYSNVRRFLAQGQTPPKDAVRSEEMINYFKYDYPEPKGDDPFSVSTELSECPWNKENKLLHIGLQGKHIPTAALPPSNLVFLIDVSGSMNTPERLPLVKAGFKLLVEQLREQDKVAIVVYASQVGLVLDPTSGNQKDKIMKAIDRLEAGGSTAGGEGIQLAYKTAQQHLITGGNNRVILATDGDFNVGVSSNAALERMIEQKREEGVFLTVLGFGMGNYKDSKMETLADKGNGNYAYVDNILEAKKVFVNEFGGTLFTIAKDVKLQLEFNPAKVKAYRLIGYENRALRNEDFNNDKKDAGEMGAGHSVTALYEIVPVGAASDLSAKVDDLKYQQVKLEQKATTSNEMLSLKVRYKEPEAENSKLFQTVVTDKAISLKQTTDNFRFSAAVAAYAMLLRDSAFKGTATYNQVLALAEGARGADKEGYRVEFINLVKTSDLLRSRATAGTAVEVLIKE
ncbi:hypothetical protein C1N53_03225 [Pontibacter sp. SGAir0037]|nr:hypothetical protein C1N53_03225 [Pontibacter sp. SGAir0037]